MLNEQLTIDQLETPAVVVDLDILESNIARFAAYAGKHALNLRPHTKTHKMPEIARMQVAAGACGITVAKTGEAEVMAHGGLDNILIAYPVFGDAKVRRIAALAREHRIIVAIDDAVTAEALAAAARNAGSRIHILVELDVGMRRCGLATAGEVVRLARHVDGLQGLSFAGINLYPGHIWASPSEQAESLRAVSAKLAEVLDMLHASGLSCEIVSGGSTPTALQSHFVGGLTEIRPGTYVYNDRNTLDAGACTLDDCALRILVTVVSHAVPGRVIVDGGSKTFSSDRLLSGLREGFGYVTQDREILFESLSEEHGHLNIVRSSHSPRIGDRLSIIPNHVCACVNLHDRIWYHRKGKIEAIWSVAGRGRVV